MKKKLPVLLMSSVLILGMGATALTACGGTEPEVPPIEEPQKTPNIDKVTITGADEIKFLGGSTIALKADVKPIDANKEYSKKVTWESSDPSVATVINGAVKFTNPAETKKVTITAISKDDNTKKASVEFEIAHSPIDLSASRGNGLDTSMYFEDGTIAVEPGDVALISSDAKGKRFYYEASITLTGFTESENFGKFGFMVGDNPEGYWVGQAENIKSGFYFVDAQRSQMGTGWNNFNFVTPDQNLINWDWGNQIGGFSTGNQKVEIDKEFKMGILRDGTNYTLFLGENEGKMIPRKTFEWNLLGPEEDAYVWIGGFGTGATVKNIVGYSGDAVESKYEIPTSLTLAKTEETVYLGNTFQLTPKFDKLAVDMTKVSYTVQDSTIATVNEKGLVTALDKKGSTKITVKYENGETVLTADFTLTVTDDEFFKVVLDGKMDDLIYTESVKMNKFRLYKNDKVYIDFYASKNQRGVYIFADYYTDQLKNKGTGWFEQDNFEFRLGTKDNLDLTDQLWASVTGSNVGEGNYAKTPLEEKDGKFNGQFELFVPYSKISKGDVSASFETDISFKVGSNPNSNWYCVPWMDSKNPEDYIYITKNGFAHGYPNLTTCSEGHEMGKEIVDKEPTCGAEGLKHKDCKWCGYREETKIPANTENHVIDLSKATVITPSTCSTHGAGKATCETCGQEIDVELPFDGTNHSDHDWANGACTHCHSEIQPGKEVVNDKKATSGGWVERKDWTELFRNKKGDFKTEVKYTFEGNLGSPDFQVWQHVLVVITDSIIPEGKQYGDNATFRMDWYGWMDDANGDDVKIADGQNTGGQFVDVFEKDMPEVIKGPTDVTLTIERKGSDLSLEYKIKPHSSEKTYTLNQSLTGLKPESLDISLSAEFCKFTVHSAKVL